MTRARRGEPTTRPGVYRLGAGQYLIRVKAKAPDGRTAEVEREIEARSPAEADAQRHKLRADLQVRLEADRAPSPAMRSDVSVSEYSLAWIERRKPELRSSTRLRYADAIAKLNAGLGHMSVRDVRKADVEVWRNGLAGRPATINGVLSVVRAIFNDAVDNGVITLSPATRVKGLPPAHDETRKAFTTDEVGRVLEVVRTRHPAWWPMVAALLFLGARFGEVSSLRWEDFDEAAGLVRIRRAQYRGEVDGTKTGKRARARKVLEVAVHPTLVAVLREHRRTLIARQHPNLASGYVFPAERTLLHTQASPVNRIIGDACRRAGVVPPARKLHALRRAFNDALRRVASGDVTRSMIGHVDELSLIHISEPTRPY